jgi:5-methyltetrahydrofolate--homocysteine methyltransferase
MTKNDFKLLCTKKTVIFDGSTGVELISRGMTFSRSLETALLKDPDKLIQLQREYCSAGSDIIITPTLGANRIKMAEHGFTDSTEDLNYELTKLSLSAVNDKTLIFGDISSTGRFVEPFGDLEFEDAVDTYKEQVRGLIRGGVEGFLIETIIDLQEARAALLAVTESCDLPVIICLSFDKDGTTINGNSAESVAVTLQSLGADAIGCNCSTGPAEMLPVIKRIRAVTSLPLMVKPNAGLPALRDGKTYFPMGVDEFISFTHLFHDAGVSLIGGCCGTNPDFIAALSEQCKGLVPISKTGNPDSLTASHRRVWRFCGEQFTLIGERINPTGKKEFQKQLRDGNLSMIQTFAAEQENLGASLLDVNMGLSGIDEQEMMVKSVSLLSKVSPLPLCIDSTRPEVIEKALRIYPGRALVNSISGEKSRIEETLPIAAKYGAMLIILPLDDNGIPKTFEERVTIINTIIKEAAGYGYTTADMVIDGLVMTISSDQQAAQTTLRLISWCKKQGINSVCGLSNVSFGLPQRDIVNSAFLALAARNGLTSAIANPSSEQLRGIINAINSEGYLI